jgi:hypothetical protein
MRLTTITDVSFTDVSFTDVLTAYLAIGLVFVLIWPIRQLITQTIDKMRFVSVMTLAPNPEWKYWAFALLTGASMVVLWPFGLTAAWADWKSRQPIGDGE